MKIVLAECLEDASTQYKILSLRDIFPTCRYHPDMYYTVSFATYPPEQSSNIKIPFLSATSVVIIYLEKITTANRRTIWVLSQSPEILTHCVMHLEKQIGQLLIVGMQGPLVTTNSPIIRDIHTRNLGGVILFDRFLHEKQPDNNIISHQQVKKLVHDLRDNAERPLLIAVDQEGGRVNRFKAERGFPVTPTAGKLGQTTGTEQTTIAAEQTAAMLASLGINLNLAPVVDLDIFPDNPIIGRHQRSFSSDPAEVTAHAMAWITAHRQHRVKTCIKHFPGHGSAHADSHLGFVDISNHWHNDEIIPYQNLIDRDMVDAVMTGHLYNRTLDQDFPATLSHQTVSGLLRAELNYDGVVLSDDMQMRAITSHYGLEEAVCRAINAGIDLLIFGNNLDYDPDITNKAIRAIIKGLRHGTITEETLTAALERVEKFKRSLTVEPH